MGFSVDADAAFMHAEHFSFGPVLVVSAAHGFSSLRFPFCFLTGAQVK